MTQAWVIVERAENWEVDRDNGFTFFGIPDRKVTLAKTISPGDRLITYVSSGIAAFADIRGVEPGNFIRLRHGGRYDTPFAVALPTKPEIVLDPARWVLLRDIVDQLELTRGTRDWRQIMRNSLRPISKADEDLLTRKIRERADKKEI